MDHSAIERHGVVERYLLRQLPEQEEEAFEEHLLGCSSCLRQLDEAEDFQSSLRAAVAEEMTRATVRAGLLSWLGRREQFVRGLLLGVFLLATPSTFLWWQNQQLNQPQANPLLVTLSTPRGSDADFEDATEIQPYPGERVILVVDLARVEHDIYNCSLLGSDGELLHTYEPLRPTSEGRLAFDLPTAFHAPGHYRALIAAPSSAGSAKVGTFRFRVVAETPRGF